MLSQRNQTKDSPRGGFTIIEVVLVLAIAGLIFLMVFIALPALQRSQRDTQRRDDLSRVATALTQYQSNNNGKLPSAGTYTGDTSLPSAGANSNGATRLVRNYLNSTNATSNEFIDPDGEPYSIVIEAALSSMDNFDHKIHVVTSVKCGDEGSVVSGQKRDFAVLYKLEGSGIACNDNA